jgi:uncharacterized protein (DUF2384 family)
MASHLHPASRYTPAPLVDLSDRAERARLSPAAVRAFFNMAGRWKLRDEDARHLLGAMSNGTFYEMKKQPDRLLDQDTLTRISYLIGIFKALNILHSEKLADAWIQLPNKNPLFSGRTPLVFMIHGGIPAMQLVRQLLDARRGGQ